MVNIDAYQFHGLVECIGHPGKTEGLAILLPGLRAGHEDLGAKRANAAKNAALDIADYVATSEERYRESAGGQ